jgi:putative DNA primase/helicase
MTDEAERDYCAEALASVGLKHEAAREPEVEIKRLAGMSSFEYCRARKTTAKCLGIGVGELDKLVRESRKAISVDDDPEHWVVEPFPEPVDGTWLLDELKATFERYLVLPAHVPEALALWVMHTWTIDVCDISPYLALISPERRCGKTTVLKLLNRLAHRAVLASNITPAALFRYIEAKHPTLLIDEFDAALKDNEEMRGILNSGHSRDGAYCIRCEGEDHYPKRFSTWAPKAFAAIKRIPDTLMDRSIVVPMRRKKKTEPRPRYRDRDSDQFRRLRSQALRWANDNIESLRDEEPEVPDALNDRAADNWRPLLAIADRAGGPWPKRGRAASLSLSGEDATDDTEGVGLLADIRGIFAERKAERLTSVALTAALVEIEGRPWAERRNGKPLTAHGLARLLKPFEVMPDTMRFGDDTAKGYALSDFNECFEAYLGQQEGYEPSQSNNADEMGTSAGFRTVTSRADVTVSKSKKPNNDGHCYDVTVRKAQNGAKSEFGQKGRPDTAQRITAPALRMNRLCDYCGGMETPADPLRPWDWPGRPDGVLLHERCEALWHDGAAQRARQPYADELEDF